MELYLGDCLDVLKTLEPESVSACVTDPPYGLGEVKNLPGLLDAWMNDDCDKKHIGKSGFMNREWDAGVPSPRYWKEVYRVMKPGAHLLCFASTRTWDLMSLSIRLAGFENRDTIRHHQGVPSLAWITGSGFPKSLDVSKQIDKHAGNGHLATPIAQALHKARTSRGISSKQADQMFCGGTTNYSWFEGRLAGQRIPSAETFGRICAEWPELETFAKEVQEAEREVVEERVMVQGGGNAFELRMGERREVEANITTPATEPAKQWEGWGTAMKPSWEVILVFRRPLEESSIARQVLSTGTGAINIAATRVAGPAGNGHWTHKREIGDGNIYGGGGRTQEDFGNKNPSTGRFPANLLLSHTSIPIMALAPDAPPGIAGEIGEYFAGYDRVQALRKASSGKASASQARSEILQQCLLGKGQEGASAGAESQADMRSVRQGVHGKGVKDQGWTTGEVLQPHVQAQGVQGAEWEELPQLGPASQGETKEHGWLCGPDAERIEPRGPQALRGNDEQELHARASTGDGENFGKAPHGKGDSTSHQRSEGRQSSRESICTAEERAYPPSQGHGPSDGQDAPGERGPESGERALEVLACDVPQQWLGYFQSTGLIFGCQRVGTKRVRGSKPSGEYGTHEQNGVNAVYGKGLNSATPNTPPYADPDGYEEIESFECARDEEGQFICPVAILDLQSGIRKSAGEYTQSLSKDNPKESRNIYGKGLDKLRENNYAGQSGGASRFFSQFHEPDTDPGFFYCAKSSRRERNQGLGSGPQHLRLRDDLTPEQREYVRQELEAVGVSL